MVLLYRPVGRSIDLGGGGTVKNPPTQIMSSGLEPQFNGTSKVTFIRQGKKDVFPTGILVVAVSTYSTRWLC
jgi:hypothetical protein